MIRRYIYFLVLLCLLVFLGLFLRFYNLGISSFSGDESLVLIRSSWLARSVQNLNPWYAYGIFVHSRVPGDIFVLLPSIFLGLSESGARSVGIVFSIISLTYLLYILGRIKQLQYGLLLISLLIVSPMVVGWSRIANSDGLDMSMLGLILAVAILFNYFPNRKNFYILIIVYSLSLWVMDTFVILAPIIAFVVYKYRKLFLNRREFYNAGLVFAFIVLPIYTARFISQFFLPHGAGFNYQIAKMGFPDIVLNMRYYMTTFFTSFSVYPAVAFIIISAFFTRVRDDWLYKFFLGTFLLYFFFFIFIFWKRQAYLGISYFPLMAAGVRSCYLIVPRQMLFSVFFPWLFGLLIFTFMFLRLGKSDNPSIWGFNYDNRNLREAAYLVRKCSNDDEFLVTDLEGYTSSLYFNRRYYRDQDIIGIDNTIRKYSNSIKVVYDTGKTNLFDNFWKLNRVGMKYIFSDGSRLYLEKCNLDPSKILSASLHRQFWSTSKIIDFYR